MGGEFIYKLTGEIGHRFAAVDSVAGQLNESTVKTCKSVRSFPILNMHGTFDRYGPGMEVT
jgi:poly(3-hydroxybutyrate) depolymerase